MTTASVADIKRIIPHRYPILLVDRITEVVPGERLVAAKAVTCNEPCYAEVDSDRPEAYAYPVPLMIESWAQAAVLLACWDHPNPDVLAGKIELAGALEKIEFGEPAYPGDVLRHEVGLVREIGDTAILAGRTVIGDRTVMDVGHFVLALRSLTDL